MDNNLVVQFVKAGHWAGFNAISELTSDTLAGNDMSHTISSGAGYLPTEESDVLNELATDFDFELPGATLACRVWHTAC